jgi:hypothetical protein
VAPAFRTGASQFGGVKILGSDAATSRLVDTGLDSDAHGKSVSGPTGAAMSLSMFFVP